MTHNDATHTHLEAILAEIVALADAHDVSGIELLEITHQEVGGDNDLASPRHVAQAQDALALLDKYTTPKLDEDDLIIELIELAADADDDLYND